MAALNAMMMWTKMTRMRMMKTMTWIADVKSGWEWKWFEDHVAKLPAPGILATINLDMMTPLLFCVNRGYMEIVRQLVDMGADRTCSDKNVSVVLVL